MYRLHKHVAQSYMELFKICILLLSYSSSEGMINCLCLSLHLSVRKIQCSSHGNSILHARACRVIDDSLWQVTVYRIVEYGDGVQPPEDTRPDPSICREVKITRNLSLYSKHSVRSSCFDLSSCSINGYVTIFSIMMHLKPKVWSVFPNHIEH